MLEDEITRKRKELNESIENAGKYEDVYRLSIELDELITEFYKDSKDKSKRRLFFNVQKNIKKILYIA